MLAPAAEGRGKGRARAQSIMNERGRQVGRCISVRMYVRGGRAAAIGRGMRRLSRRGDGAECGR